MHRRLRELPIETILGCEVRVATTFASRLLGLSHLDRSEAGAGLLIPRCAAVHTLGMRFALDLVFLDGAGGPRSLRCGLQPRRLAADRRACAVLELPEGSLEKSLFAAIATGAGGESSPLRP